MAQQCCKFVLADKQSLSGSVKAWVLTRCLHFCCPALQWSQTYAASADWFFQFKLSTWAGEAPQEQQAALAATRSEVAAAADALRDTAVQQARATAAAKSAEAAAAEQERLQKENARMQEEQEQDNQQQAAVTAAVAQYQQAIDGMVQSSRFMADLYQQHEVSSAWLSRALQ